MAPIITQFLRMQNGLIGDSCAALSRK